MRPESDTTSPRPIASTEIDEPDSTAETVVQAVAAVDNEPIEALPPLASVVDPDALTSLFESTATGRISFRYNDHTVVVGATDEIAVY